MTPRFPFLALLNHLRQFQSLSSWSFFVSHSAFLLLKSIYGRALASRRCFNEASSEVLQVSRTAESFLCCHVYGLRSPALTVAYHVVENGQQFSHRSCQCNRLEFAFCHQSVVEPFDQFVVSCRGECCHVEHASYLGTPAARYTFFVRLAALIHQRSHADELCDLGSVY